MAIDQWGHARDKPGLIQPGTITWANSGDQWGDYSATTLDPTDDWSFWTVQEYAKPWTNNLGSVFNVWGTVIGKIKPNL